MMERLFERNGGIDDEKIRTIQVFRLAGLLHDIGHYPFSHATQDAIKEYYSRKVMPESGQRLVKHSAALDHEDVGGKVLRIDEQLGSALKRGRFEIKPAEISVLFRRDELQPYTNILSSDLDADRLDHLCRTSHFAGLPYGSIDLDYIVSQVCADSEKNAALTRRAVKAADHLLLSRIFDYRQVAKHRTVAAFEWLLQDVLVGLLETSDDLDWTEDGVVTMIRDGKWAEFTDASIIERVKAKLTGSDKPFAEEVTTEKARALLARRAPKNVGEIERFSPRAKAGEKHNVFSAELREIKLRVKEWAQDFKIPEPLWAVLDKRIKLTEMGSQFREEDEGAENTLRIVNQHGDKSEPLNSLSQSLMSVLSEYNLELIRVYVLLGDGQDDLRNEIKARVHSDFPHYGWS